MAGGGGEVRADGAECLGSGEGAHAAGDQQLATRCLVPSWPGDQRTDLAAAEAWNHYPADGLPKFMDGDTRMSFHVGCDGIVLYDESGAFCAGCEAEGLRTAECEGRQVTPRCLVGCWVATCDGPCSKPLIDWETEDTLHSATRDVIEQWAADEKWVVTPDGQAFCEDDTQAAGVIVAGRIPGQLLLDGNPIVDKEPTVG